jgi:14-3-3 protein epsilon
MPELEKICQELLDVLEKHLLPEDHSAEGQVFYWKMAGDYWRYLAEFATADDRKAKAESAKQKYEKATKTAQEKSLPPTNPIRLGLALNYSVRPRHAHARVRGRGMAQSRT